MLIIHQDTIWHCQRETEVESDGGICRIPDKERDMTARPVWGQTNLSLVPACLMSHSLATRWGDPHNINILMPPPPLFLPSTFCVVHPFTCSAGFPHTHQHWHRYVVERGEKLKNASIQHTRQKPDTDINEGINILSPSGVGGPCSKASCSKVQPSYRKPVVTAGAQIYYFCIYMLL